MDDKKRSKMVVKGDGCFYVDKVRFDYWIYRNLRDYGNCVIPNCLIKAHGIDRIEKLLALLMKKKEVIISKGSALRSKDATYIATVFDKNKPKRR